LSSVIAKGQLTGAALQSKARDTARLFAGRLALLYCWFAGSCRDCQLRGGFEGWNQKIAGT